jgi:hypothetical protein
MIPHTLQHLIPLLVAAKTYMARFEAAWSLQFTPITSTASTSIVPTVLISASTVKFDSLNLLAMPQTVQSRTSLVQALPSWLLSI